MTLPWMAAKILLRAVAELRPHTGNARVHSAEQLEQIKASMLAFGFTNPLLVDEDGVLIAGHGRLEAASALGMAKVPVWAPIRQRSWRRPIGCWTSRRRSASGPIPMAMARRQRGFWPGCVRPTSAPWQPPPAGRRPGHRRG